MKLRILGATSAAAFVLAMAGCGGGVDPGSVLDQGADLASAAPSVGVSIDPSAAAKALNITTTEGLKLALEAVGISDVHPVASQDGSIAAWAAVPKFKKCPVLFVRTPDGSYEAIKLRKPDGSEQQIEGLGAQPTPLDFAGFALKNLSTMADCNGDQAPAEADWPKTA